MSTVTLTVRVETAPRRLDDGRCGIWVAGRHSKRKLRLAAEDVTADQLLRSVSKGDLLTVTLWADERPGHFHKRFYTMSSFTVHPREGVA